MTPLGVAIACAALSVVGAVIANVGKRRAVRGASYALHWSHPSVQMKEDPDEVIRHASRGLEIARRGRRLALHGMLLALVGLVGVLVSVLWGMS